MLIRAGGSHRTRRSKKNKRTCNDDRETTESLNSGLLLPRFCTCFFYIFMIVFIVVLFHVSLTRRYSSGLKTSVWSELSEEVASNLSKSVVSVAVLDGDYLCCSLFYDYIYLH